MTTLLQILAATLLSSVLSIVLAGLISFKFLDRYMSKMLCRFVIDSGFYPFTSRGI